MTRFILPNAGAFYLRNESLEWIELYNYNRAQQQITKRLNSKYLLYYIRLPCCCCSIWWSNGQGFTNNHQSSYPAFT